VDSRLAVHDLCHPNVCANAEEAVKPRSRTSRNAHSAGRSIPPTAIDTPVSRSSENPMVIRWVAVREDPRYRGRHKRAADRHTSRYGGRENGHQTI